MKTIRFNPQTIKVPTFMDIKMKRKPRQTISLSPPKLNFSASMKKLSYPQAKARFPKLSPYGDADGDHILNKFDCRPFDYFKHAVRPEDVDKPVHTWSVPDYTFGKAFAKAETKLPMFFKGPDEDYYSGMLTNALKSREERKKIEPFKDLVGVHKVNVKFDSDQTQLAHALLKRYLEEQHQGITFLFDKNNPTKVSTIDYRVTDSLLNKLSFSDFKFKKRYDQLTPDQQAVVMQRAKELSSRGVRTSPKSISKYLQDAPEEYAGLLNHLDTSGEYVHFLISDEPVDVMMKSTHPKKKTYTMDKGKAIRKIKEGGAKELAWTSCERMGGPYSEGIWHDIELQNAVAYVYLGKKTPGKDTPSGRIMLRWGDTNDGKVDVGVEAVAYPWGSPDYTGSKKKGTLMSNILRYALQKVLQKKGYFLGEVKTPYRYRGYSDVETSGNQRIYFNLYQKPIIKPQPVRESFIDLSESDTIPVPFQYHMARDLSREIRGRVAMQETAPTPVLRSLASAYEPEVQEKVAQRPDLLEKHRSVYFSLTEAPEDIRKGLLISGPPPPEAEEKLLETERLGQEWLYQPWIRPKHHLKLLDQPYAGNALAYSIAGSNKLSAPVMAKASKVGGVPTKRRLIEHHAESLTPSLRKQYLGIPELHEHLISYVPLTDPEVQTLWDKSNDETRIKLINKHYNKLPYQTISSVIKSSDPDTIGQKYAIMEKVPISLDAYKYLAIQDKSPDITTHEYQKYYDRLLGGLDGIPLTNDDNKKAVAESLYNIIPRIPMNNLAIQDLTLNLKNTPYYDKLINQQAQRALESNSFQSTLKQKYDRIRTPTLSSTTLNLLDEAVLKKDTPSDSPYNFKVGDTVYVSPDSFYHPGKTGTIVRRDARDYDSPNVMNYVVRVGSKEYWVYTKYLSHVKETTIEPISGTTRPQATEITEPPNLPHPLPAGTLVTMIEDHPTSDIMMGDAGEIMEYSDGIGDHAIYRISLERIGEILPIYRHRFRVDSLPTQPQEEIQVGSRVRILAHSHADIDQYYDIVGWNDRIEELYGEVVTVVDPRHEDYAGNDNYVEIHDPERDITWAIHRNFIVPEG